jgi:hypothetical protein
MSQVRFQVLSGPASLHPRRMSRLSPARPDETPIDGDDGHPGIGRLEVARPAAVELVTATAAVTVAGTPAVPSSGHAYWYGWRLMGANNRELGRTAHSFVSYPLARRSIGQLKQCLARLVQQSTTDPRTGRWGWRLDLDGVAVAVSSRWYEREHDSRLGAAKFVELSAEAEPADGVVTLHERRGPNVIRLWMGGAA